jgi:hypothetical protein
MRFRHRVAAPRGPTTPDRELRGRVTRYRSGLQGTTTLVPNRAPSAPRSSPEAPVQAVPPIWGHHHRAPPRPFESAQSHCSSQPGPDRANSLWARIRALLTSHSTRRPPRGADGVLPYALAGPGPTCLSSERLGGRGGLGRFAAYPRPIRAPGARRALCSSRSCRGGTDNRAHPCPLKWPQSLCSSQFQARGRKTPFGHGYETDRSSHGSQAPSGGRRGSRPHTLALTTRSPALARRLADNVRGGRRARSIRAYPCALARGSPVFKPFSPRGTDNRAHPCPQRAAIPVFKPVSG